MDVHVVNKVTKEVEVGRELRRLGPRLSYLLGFMITVILAGWPARLAGFQPSGRRRNVHGCRVGVRSGQRVCLRMRMTVRVSFFAAAQHSQRFLHDKEGCEAREYA